MAIPTGVATGQVQVTAAVSADGSPGSGTVVLRPTVTVTGHSAIITTEPVTLTVTDGAAPAVTLVSNDDSGLLPLGWRYEVREYISGEYRAPYYIDVPADTVVDLSTAPRSEVVPAVWRTPRTVAGIGPDTTGDIPAADLQAVLDVSSGGSGVPSSRQILAGTGLTGGGDLSADRTLAVAYGTTATTAARGDDPRLSNARTPTAHTHAQSEVTNLTTALAAKVDTSDPRLTDERPPTAHTHPISDVTSLQTALDARVQLALVDAKGDLLAATGTDTLTRLPAGADGQVLTADAAQPAGLRWATPSGGGGSSELLPDRWGCLAVTFPPHSVNPVDPQLLRMVSGRLYAYWLPLPVGTVVSAVRVPIGEPISAAGGLWFAVYQDDGSLLGDTGDVAAEFSSGGTAWRTATLPTPAATTGDGVWVTALSTVADASAAQLVFCDVTAPEVPIWLFDGKALRVEGLSTLPATFAPGTGTAYYDALIGVA